MKIINKIKAFFRKDNDPIEMDIYAAEIKEGKAFLHPKNDPKATYLIRSDDIRISISEGRSVAGQEIIAVVPKSKQPMDAQKEQTQQEIEKKARETAAKKGEQQNSTNQPIFAIPGFERYKKRTFSVSLYPEEYDMIIENMKGYGYKRADFFLACVQTAKKTNIEKAHKQILLEQQELIAQQLTELEKAQPAV